MMVSSRNTTRRSPAARRSGAYRASGHLFPPLGLWLLRRRLIYHVFVAPSPTNRQPSRTPPTRGFTSFKILHFRTLQRKHQLTLSICVPVRRTIAGIVTAHRLAIYQSQQNELVPVRFGSLDITT